VPRLCTHGQRWRDFNHLFALLLCSCAQLMHLPEHLIILCILLYTLLINNQMILVSLPKNGCTAGWPNLISNPKYGRLSAVSILACDHFYCPNEYKLRILCCSCIYNSSGEGRAEGVFRRFQETPLKLSKPLRFIGRISRYSMTSQFVLPGEGPTYSTVHCSNSQLSKVL